jgi:hypothetical protein
LRLINLSTTLSIDPDNEFFGDSLIEQSSWTENFAASGNNTIKSRDLFNVNAATLSKAAATGEPDQEETKPFFVTRERPASKLHFLPATHLKIPALLALL